MVQRVAELVGSCVPIHAYQDLPNPNCVFYPSGLSLYLSIESTNVAFIQLMTWFSSTAWTWSVMADLVSYTVLPCSGGSSLRTRCGEIHFFFCAAWSSDRTSRLSPQYMNWSSSCKGHDWSNRSFPHPWPCPLGEPRFSCDFQVTCFVARREHDVRQILKHSHYSQMCIVRTFCTLNCTKWIKLFNRVCIVWVW